jgi:hypothetical protein
MKSTAKQNNIGDIDVLKLDTKTLDRMHKEKLEYVKYFLKAKIKSAFQFSHPSESEEAELRKKIKLFEEMG